MASTSLGALNLLPSLRNPFGNGRQSLSSLVSEKENRVNKHKRAQSLGGEALTSQLLGKTRKSDESDSLSPRKKARRSLVRL